MLIKLFYNEPNLFLNIFTRIELIIRTIINALDALILLYSVDEGGHASFAANINGGKNRFRHGSHRTTGSFAANCLYQSIAKNCNTKKRYFDVHFMIVPNNNLFQYRHSYQFKRID